MYLVSCGDEMYIVTVRKVSDSIVYDQVIGRAVEEFFKQN
jgi:hypothetical protein